MAGNDWSDEQKKALFQLAEKLTGMCQGMGFRREILVTNVQRRMMMLGYTDYAQYMEKVLASHDEMGQFISALTIHTTDWFRESPHFEFLEKHLSQVLSQKDPPRKWKLLSAACSSGEELWSAGLVLEFFRRENSHFDYELHGRDVDPVSVEEGKRCIYSQNELKNIPQKYRRDVLLGEGKTDGLFTIDKEIRQRGHFRVQNLVDGHLENGRFDAIFCRNVLIYFEQSRVDAIIQKLLRSLSPNGVLILGHSETADVKKFGLKSLGHSIYQLESASGASPMRLTNSVSTVSHAPDGASGPLSNRRRKVLIVDDSATVRKALSRVLEKNFEVYTCSTAEEASTWLADPKGQGVDLITLDLNLPGVDGAQWLIEQRRRQMKIPVVVISDAAPAEAAQVLGALSNGAQDIIEKSRLAQDASEVLERLTSIADSHKGGEGSSSHRHHKGGDTKHLTRSNPFQGRKPELLLVGASTGGTEALANLLKDMPKDSPPIVVVQHISRSFCKPFAERMARVSGLQLGEPIDGSLLRPGTIYLAFDDSHIGVKQAGGSWVLEVSQGELVSGHRPSVDWLFQSAARCGGRIMALLLTGMGKDGAKGMLELYKGGAYTLAQSEESCVVYGMPREAMTLKAVRDVGDIPTLRGRINSSLAPQKAAC